MINRDRSFEAVFQVKLICSEETCYSFDRILNVGVATGIVGVRVLLRGLLGIFLAEPDILVS